MLSFTLNNKELLLDESVSVRLTWRNPFFAFREFLGDVGLRISIPVNPHNRALLGNPERIEKHNTTSNEFENFEIRFSGVLLMAGTLVLQPSSSAYSCWLRSTIGNIGKIHREKFIGNSPSFSEPITFVNKANYVPGTDDYACPEIFNPEFYRDQGKAITIAEGEEYEKETTTFSQAFARTAQYFVNKRNPDNTIKTSDSSAGINFVSENLDLYVVSPMLFLNSVFQSIFKDLGYYPDNDFISQNEDLKKLLIYNNYDITNMSFTTFTDWINGYWPDEETITSRLLNIDSVRRNYTKAFLYKSLLPEINISDFVVGVQNLCNVFTHFKQRNKFDVIDREAVLLGESFDISEYIVGDWDPPHDKKDIALKFTFDHDDDDTLFSERWTDIESFRGNLGDDVDNYSDLETLTPELEEIRYVKDFNLFVQYKWTEQIVINESTGLEETIDSLGWQHFTIGFQNGFFNFGKDTVEEFPTHLSTLICGNYTMAYQKGTIATKKEPFNNFSLRLLFSNGNNEASFETDNISIDWEKQTTGLLSTRWRYTAPFMASRRHISGTAQFPLNVLDLLIRELPYKKKAVFGEFLIEEMECEFGLNYIGQTKIKGVKIGNIYSTMTKYGAYPAEQEEDFNPFEPHYKTEPTSPLEDPE